MNTVVEHRQTSRHSALDIWVYVLLILQLLYLIGLRMNELLRQLIDLYVIVRAHGYVPASSRQTTAYGIGRLDNG